VASLTITPACSDVNLRDLAASVESPLFLAFLALAARSLLAPPASRVTATLHAR
jgi:hypothetical protein